MPPSQAMYGVDRGRSKTAPFCTSSSSPLAGLSLQPWPGPRSKLPLDRSCRLIWVQPASLAGAESGGGGGGESGGGRESAGGAASGGGGTNTSGVAASAGGGGMKTSGTAASATAASGWITTEMQVPKG